jgi:hypothetical protein
MRPIWGEAKTRKYIASSRWIFDSDDDLELDLPPDETLWAYRQVVDTSRPIPTIFGLRGVTAILSIHVDWKSTNILLIPVGYIFYDI